VRLSVRVGFRSSQPPRDFIESFVDLATLSIAVPHHGSPSVDLVAPSAAAAP
jgi:hypothetical protein